MFNPLEELCFIFSRRAVRDMQVAQGTLTTTATYLQHGETRLQRQFTRDFEQSRIVGRRVLDFGSGAGQLSRLVWELGARSVIGVDLSEENVALAREAAASQGLGDNVSFLVGDPEAIPIPDATADVVLCFDVMEHVLAYQAIIKEWRRVLSPGGRVLICWTSLWMHPYGHHCYPLVGVPWAHLLLSDAALLRVCARTYDMPEFQPRFWEKDEHGKKKSNPFMGNTTFDDYLNKLTTWEFERCCRHSGLEISRKEVFPFSGDRLRFVKRSLASIPYLSDAFCARVVYELVAV